MIGFLRGNLVERQPTRLVIDVQGVGYEVLVPISTYEKIKSEDTQVSLLTYLYVREDTLQLYGFATKEEKKLFLQLIGVSGIGPKVALGILSGCSVDTFCQAIYQGEVMRLKALPGIGKKTAERLILELKDKVQPAGDARLPQAAIEQSQQTGEALLALVSLGYNRARAEKVIAKLAASQAAKDVETLIKLALQQL